MSGLFPPTKEELIACARRELSMRQSVYPRWIASGKMTREKADHEILCMEEIVKHLKGEK